LAFAEGAVKNFWQA